MKNSDFELKWEIYELPESSRVYWVTGTRIERVYGLLPNPSEGIYSTYNAAKRAVARYRKEAEEYWYSHPNSSLKNMKKQITISFDRIWERFEEKCEKEGLDSSDLFLSKSKTVKIRKIKIEGLPEYERAKRKDEEQ